jgi:hypothetical protein
MMVALFFTPYFIVVERRRESQLREDYRRKARLLKLSELASREARGILLVEIRSPGCFGHLWWAEDESLDSANCPLPIAGQTSILDAMEAIFDSDICHEWCVKNLATSAPNAILIDVNARKWAKAIPDVCPPVRMVDDSLWWHLQRGEKPIPSSGPKSRKERS